MGLTCHPGEEAETSRLQRHWSTEHKKMHRRLYKGEKADRHRKRREQECRKQSQVDGDRSRQRKNQNKKQRERAKKMLSRE